MGESEVMGGPVDLWIMSFEPICSENDIVDADVRDVKFGSFLMVCVIVGGNVDGLDGCGVYWSGFI
jgi:hypothetical protein